MSKRNIPLWLLATIILMQLIGAAIPVPQVQAQSYSLPNVNSGCPDNCRQIPWQAGSDLWNAGTLPNYTAVTCSPLNANGSTDDTSNIQNCINAAAAGTGSYASCAGRCAVYLPPGTIYINGAVRLKNGVVLRGAGPTTQINLGSGGELTTQNFSSTNISPSTSYSVRQSTYTLTGTPQKGDTTVTIGSGTVSTGTWMKIYGNDDPTLVNGTGTDGNCNWCGDNTGYYLQQQYAQVTAINSGSGGAGSVVTISRPLYYTPYTAAVSSLGEPAGAKYSTITFPTQKAGYENFHVTATGDIGSGSIIYLQGCLYCWVKGVETQNTGSNSDSAHVRIDYSYGTEIRDSYLHDMRSGASGAGYGIFLNFTSGDHKIENNIMRHNRHSLTYQGGSGVAVLYNYIDDNYTDDTDYLGSARTSHGAHPYMNLFEGNVISHIAADDFWGTSSHTVFFRNWIWGDETQNWSGAVARTGTPGSGYDAVDLYQSQSYYSYVGNVLGRTGLHTTWSAAKLSITCSTNSCGYESPDSPGVYSYGSSKLGSAAASSTTILRHGNWDYKTIGVAYWDGGTNHTLASSMYYPSAPKFLSGYPWPLEGPEGNPTINPNAAQTCYLNGPAKGAAFDPNSCYGSSSSTLQPAPPTNVQAPVVAR